MLPFAAAHGFLDGTNTDITRQPAVGRRECPVEGSPCGQAIARHSDIGHSVQPTSENDTGHTVLKGVLERSPSRLSEPPVVRRPHVRHHLGRCPLAPWVMTDGVAATRSWWQLGRPRLGVRERAVIAVRYRS